MAKAFIRDGHVRQITADDVQPGVVIREVSRQPGYEDGAISPPFPDHVILAVKDGVAYLARPYLYATLVGTTSPSALTGVSKTEVLVERLCREDSLFMLVVGSRGQAFKFET